MNAYTIIYFNMRKKTLHVHFKEYLHMTESRGNHDGSDRNSRRHVRVLRSVPTHFRHPSSNGIKGDFAPV